MECEVCVNGMRLEQLSEFKYLGCVLDESGTDEAVCCRKVASGKRIAGAMRSLVSGRGLQLECGRRRRGLGLGLYKWTTSENF